MGGGVLVGGPTVGGGCGVLVGGGADVGGGGGADVGGGGGGLVGGGNGVAVGGIVGMNTRVLVAVGVTSVGVARRVGRRPGEPWLDTLVVVVAVGSSVGSMMAAVAGGARVLVGLIKTVGVTVGETSVGVTVGSTSSSPEKTK